MATSASKAAPKAAADEAPVKKSKKKLLLIVALVVLLAAGGGAYFMFGRNHEGGAEKPKHEAAKPPVFMTMEPFTVNLQSEGSEQFLQLAFTLQVADNEQVERLKLYTPQIRSRLLMLLSSKKASEINTAEGKKKLGADVMAAVNQPFAAGGKKQEVTDVFFTSFVIQ